MFQVIDKLETWLSRPFLLGNYFPWLVVAALNLVMVYVSFPEAAPYIDRYVRGEPADKAITVALVLGAIAVVAYVTSPLLRVLTGILEGQHIPEPLAQRLSEPHARRLRELEARGRELLLERQRLFRHADRIARRLTAARDAGESLQAIKDTDAIDAAEAAVEKLEKKRNRNQLITIGELIAGVAAVARALKRNCANPERLRMGPGADDLSRAERLRIGAGADDLRRAEQTRELQTRILALAKYAANLATSKHALVAGQRQRHFAVAELAPTRLGNEAAALRSYCETRYRIDYDFFWARFQIVVQKQKDLSASLVNAKIQLDFCVLSLWLTWAFVASWLVILGFHGTSLAPLLWVATLGPPIAAAWLGIVHASYAGFAEFVRGAIDLYRFDVLETLHHPLPAGAFAEKLAWERATRRLKLGEEVEQAFKHAKS